MSSFVVVDDSNYDFFKYTGASWILDGGGADYMKKQYWNETMSRAMNDGDSVSFSYTGSDFIVFGGRRINHGFYSIVVDDGIEQWFDGFLNQDQAQGILYTSSGLSRGQHKVTVTNRPRSKGLYWFDLDYVAYNLGDTTLKPVQTEGSPVSPIVFATGGLDAISALMGAQSVQTLQVGGAPGGGPAPTPTPASTFVTTSSLAAGGYVTMTVTATGPVNTIQTGIPGPGATTMVTNAAGEVTRLPAIESGPSGSNLSSTTGKPGSLSTTSRGQSPALPGETGAGAASEGSQTTASSTPKLAIIIPCVVIGVAIIAVILGLLWRRRRMRLREQRGRQSMIESSFAPSRASRYDRLRRGTGWTRSMTSFGNY